MAGAAALPLLVVALGIVGCATAARPVATTTAADQERLVLDLRAKNAGYVRRIEELENRIFILEDQLDSRRLAAEQRAPATLPSARVLRAVPRAGAKAPLGAKTTAQSGDAAAAGSAPAEDAASTVQTSIVAEHAVDYAGDAVQGVPPPPSTDAPPGPRPLLQLSASSAGREHPARTPPARPTSRAPEPLVDSPAPIPPTRALVDPLKNYREALETLRAGHPDSALAEFRRFLDANPQHDYADNAQYWIGECYYGQHQFRAAERAFREVVERYPHGNKVPDAMLKLGFTLQSLGDEGGGRAVLESLARAFPKHEAARLASERLAHPEPPPLGRAAQAPSPTLGTILPLPPGQLSAPPPRDARGESGSR